MGKPAQCSRARPAPGHPRAAGAGADRAALLQSTTGHLHRPPWGNKWGQSLLACAHRTLHGASSVERGSGSQGWHRCSYGWSTLSHTSVLRREDMSLWPTFSIIHLTRGAVYTDAIITFGNYRWAYKNLLWVLVFCKHLVSVYLLHGWRWSWIHSSLIASKYNRTPRSWFGNGDLNISTVLEKWTISSPATYA